MNRTFSDETLANICKKLETSKSEIQNPKSKIQNPIHVVCGANLFNFGAYDYTASFGISGSHQHLRHEAYNFARQMMQIALSPLNVRLSDSVTTEIPITVYTGENLSEKQIVENKRAIQTAWRTHFNNVTFSLINGFYQSWDLHPAQLPARYAAVYAFFFGIERRASKAFEKFYGKSDTGGDNRKSI
jgi:hypothetical protein